MVSDPDVFGCRLATGRCDSWGYAYHGRSRAHVVAWVAANGPVPPGMQLDHLCRRRNCTTLHHLEVVTPSENTLRQSWDRRIKRQRCPAGHDLNVSRVITPEQGIVCRICNRRHQNR